MLPMSATCVGMLAGLPCKAYPELPTERSPLGSVPGQGEAFSGRGSQGGVAEDSIVTRVQIHLSCRWGRECLHAPVLLHPIALSGFS